MAEQLLDDAQVGPALEQVGRERVAQRVRRDPAGEPGARRPRRDGRPGLLPASRRPRSPRNSGPPRVPASTCPAASQRRPRAGPGPAAEPVEGDVADRHEPLPVALADDADEAAVERQVLAVEPERLADPQTGRVQQLQQRPVAQCRVARLGGASPPAASRRRSASATSSVSGSSRDWRGRSSMRGDVARDQPLAEGEA